MKEYKAGGGGGGGEKSGGSSKPSSKASVSKNVSPTKVSVFLNYQIRLNYSESHQPPNLEVKLSFCISLVFFALSITYGNFLSLDLVEITKAKSISLTMTIALMTALPKNQSHR